MPEPLPTEPGIYEGAHFPTGRALYDPYVLTRQGEWFEMNREGWSRVLHPEEMGPFVRLVPATPEGTTP